MNKYNFNYLFLTFCIVVGVISRITNFGWALIALFPVIIAYYILFYLSNSFFLDKFKDELNFGKNIIFYFNCFLFLVSNLLFPDGGDGPRAVALFGLIEFVPTMLPISFSAAILSSLLSLTEIVWLKFGNKIRK